MVSSSATLFFFGASLLFTVVLASEPVEVPKFSYAEPAKWGCINRQVTVCLSGKRQSPIDINTSDIIVDKTLHPLTRNYHVYNASLSTDGIDVEVVFSGRGELVIDGKTYNLKQMHWHTPSEHLLNGVQYAAELHQVHVATDGSRAVVGILFKHGPPNPVLTMLKPQLDELAKNPCQGHEQKFAIPRFESFLIRRRSREYYRYPGSLTTPPCDENVIWNVLTKVKTISEDQVAALKAPLCPANKIKNARPTQALNGRKVQRYGGH